MANKLTRTDPLSAYEFTLGRYPSAPHTAFGTTMAKARYAAYLDLAECYETFPDFLHDIKSSRRVCVLPRPDKAFAEMRVRRSIPFARIGMTVMVGGRYGTIVGVNASDNLDILFDGDTTPSNCHPTWNIAYYDDVGNLLADFREARA